MSRFPNGGIPAHLLVEVGPYHWLTPGTAQRWAALVADVLANEGVRLRITPGKNAYRDHEGQVFARENACAEGNCNDAAYPGTSSHGGEYRGRDSMAIDVANWGELGQAKWYAYCRKHGFEPGFFDWEPWHIIDWNPWSAPVPPKPKPKEEPEEEPTLEEIMAFKSVAIGYRPNEKADEVNSTGLDWADGAKSGLSLTNKAYSESWFGALTEGGLKILSKGHYDSVMREFDAHQKVMRARELELARAVGK